METVRCGKCSKLLAKADFAQIEIKCTRCGTLNYVRAKSLEPERPGASPHKETLHAKETTDL